MTDERAVPDVAALLASIVATSRDGTLATDPEGVIAWVGPATEQVLGRSRSELLGNPLRLLIPVSDRAELESLHREVLSGSAVDPLRTGVLRTDGTVMAAVVTLGTLRDAGGHPVGATCIVRDVTDEHAHHLELERALREHRARVDQSSVPQALLDLGGSFLSANAALCDLLGYEAWELIGRSVHALGHPTDADRAEADLAPLRRGEVTSASYERLARRSDGSSLPLLLDATVLTGADREPYAIALVARDVSAVRDAQRRLDAQQSLFRALNRRSSDTSVVLDADFNISYISPSVQEMFDYHPDELVMHLGWDFIHPEDQELVAPVVESVSSEPDHTERVTYRIRTASGSWRWVEATITNCLTDPDIGGLVFNLRDITEQVEAREALAESEARYRAIVETAQEGILVMGPHGETLFANERLSTVTGIPLDDIYRRGILTRLPAEVAAALLGDPSAGAEVAPQQFEVTYAHPDGAERVLSASAKPFRLDGGTATGSLAMLSDVTEARQTEARLRWQALHDSLTELPNRALLLDRLEMAVARAERGHSSGLAVLFIDLDDFKAVNDSRGHEAGDRLLVEVAARLSSAVRTVDTAARLSGDEFAVVCEDADEDVALLIASRIRARLADPMHLDGAPVTIAASIGVAVSPPHAAATLLHFADAAMYDAKGAGGDTIAVYGQRSGTSDEVEPHRP